LLRLRLIFLDPQYGTSCHPFDAYYFDVAPGFSENLCILSVMTKLRRRKCVVIDDWYIGKWERNVEHVDAYVFWFPPGKTDYGHLKP
jgi:hypothetical protein